MLNVATEKNMGRFCRYENSRCRRVRCRGVYGISVQPIPFSANFPHESQTLGWTKFGGEGAQSKRQVVRRAWVSPGREFAASVERTRTLAAAQAEWGRHLLIDTRSVAKTDHRGRSWR